MKHFRFPCLAAFCGLLVFACANAQSGASAQPNETKTAVANKDAANKSAGNAEAERIVRERRANAQSLLINLAADAGNFSDQRLRARTQARIADVLWEVDQERSRTLFRKAWDAAEIVDREGRQRMEDEIKQQQAKKGNSAVVGPPNFRGEVLRLAARRDRALGEELLSKLKTDQQRETAEATDKNRSNVFDTPQAITQRLSLARQLLDADVERAMQFADPALVTITREGTSIFFRICARKIRPLRIGVTRQCWQRRPALYSLMPIPFRCSRLISSLPTRSLRIPGTVLPPRRQLVIIYLQKLHLSCGWHSFAPPPKFCSDPWRRRERTKPLQASKGNI